MGKRVLICGSRNYKNIELIRAWLSKLQDWGYDTIIEGEARGADSIARDEALKMNFIVLKYPAPWEEYKKKYSVKDFGMKWKSAGADRNTQMLAEGKPDLVVAFHKDINNSKGTLNMVTQAKRAKIEVIIVDD